MPAIIEGEETWEFGDYSRGNCDRCEKVNECE